MSVPDISSLLKALDIRGSSAAAVCISAVAIYLLSAAQLFELHELGAWARGVAAVVAIVAGCIWGASAYEAIAGYVRARRDAANARAETERERQAEVEKRKVAQAAVIKHLDTLSDRERKILGHLVHKNERSFQAHVDGELAAPLVAKGIATMTPGIQSAIDWVFMIPEFVWVELQARKASLPRPSRGDAPPWRDVW